MTTQSYFLWWVQVTTDASEIGPFPFATLPDRKNHNNGPQNMAVGLVLFILGILMMATGIIAIQAFGSLLFLISLGLMLMGYVEYARKKNLPAPAPSTFAYPQSIIIQTPQMPTQFHSEVTREIVKVRCRNCNSLNFETAARCSNCGASL